MPDNYLNTAERMNESSTTLHQSKEFHNACYCAGYVIECYLKLFADLGLITRPRDYGHDINSLNTALTYSLTNSSSAGAFRQYILNVSIECVNIRSSWHPLKRYVDNADAWGETVSDNFQIEKEKCMAMITRMKIDAII